jgi:hypothetical protein
VVYLESEKILSRVVVYTLSDGYGNEPGDTTPAAFYGVRDFTIDLKTSTGWVQVASVTANTLAKRVLQFEPRAATAVRITVTAGAYYKSRLVELEAWGTPGSVASTNVAASSAGAFATASSSAGPGYLPGTAIDGVRTGAGWGAGGGWEDSTYNQFPDWLEVQFTGVRAIQRVVVYTLADSYGTEPTATTTANTYGVRDFLVEGWNGGSWSLLATVTGNTLARREVSFAPFNTQRIRITVLGGAYFKSRIVEVEAFGYAPQHIPANFAQPLLGTVATASSSAGTAYPASLVNDGVRTGASVAPHAGWWEDATYNAYPDWVELAMNLTISLQRVVVYTVSNSYGVEPDNTTSASVYGVRDFNVEAWSGSAWVRVATVTGNTLARRELVLPEVRASKLRVNVTNGAYFKSRIVEIEAWGHP